MHRLSRRSLLDGTWLLRPLEPGDAAAWLAILADPRVFGPTSWDISSLDELKPIIDRHVAEGQRWAVVRAADGTLVGTCGATRWGNHEAEVAYELSPTVWGGGVATAAVRAFIDEATGAGLRRVVAHTWVDNHPSAAVLQRCGLRPVQRLPAFRSCRGELRDFWRWSRDLQADGP